MPLSSFSRPALRIADETLKEVERLKKELEIAKAGKTTSFYIIAGFIHPTNGKVYIISVEENAMFKEYDLGNRSSMSNEEIAETIRSDISDRGDDPNNFIYR